MIVPTGKNKSPLRMQKRQKADVKTLLGNVAHGAGCKFNLN